jgi:quercetin dioxygenase-like cupin family protein
MPIFNMTLQKEIELIPGYFVKFVHTERMTAAYFRIKAGAITPEHSHVQEQISNVISGQFELTVDGTDHLLEPGKVFAIPSGIRHKGRAITDCTIIDIFSPVREDYLKLTP